MVDEVPENFAEAGTIAEGELQGGPNLGLRELIESAVVAAGYLERTARIRGDVLPLMRPPRATVIREHRAPMHRGVGIPVTGNGHNAGC